MNSEVAWTPPDNFWNHKTHNMWSTVTRIVVICIFVLYHYVPYIVIYKVVDLVDRVFEPQRGAKHEDSV
jgi:hypothetical protein